jgi:hypothetical protein
MTYEEKETIQRMLGQIEGIGYALDDKFANPLFSCIEIISDVLNREKGGAE